MGEDVAHPFRFIKTMELQMNAKQAIIQIQLSGEQLPHHRFYKYVMTTRARLIRKYGIITYDIRAIAVPSNCSQVS